MNECTNTFLCQGEGYHEVRSWKNPKVEEHRWSKWSRTETTDKPKMAELCFMLWRWVWQMSVTMEHWKPSLFPILQMVWLLESLLRWSSPLHTFQFVGIPLKDMVLKMKHNVPDALRPINVDAHHLPLPEPTRSAVAKEIVHFPGLNDTWLRLSLLSAKPQVTFIFFTWTTHTKLAQF